VVVDASGAVKDVIGSGLAGELDGDFGEASFTKPQRLAESGDLIYVADTGNHAIRAIGRKARTVVTIAGTGTLGESFLSKERAPALTTELRSPCHVAMVSGTLYIRAIDLHTQMSARSSGSISSSSCASRSNALAMSFRVDASKSRTRDGQRPIASRGAVSAFYDWLTECPSFLMPS
jgi:hypothetical protein